MVMLTNENSTKIVNFMATGAGILVLRHGHIVYMQYFSHFLVYTGTRIRQIKYIVKMTNEGSTKVVNFMTHGARVLMLGHDHICHYRNYFLLYQYTAFCVSHNKCCFKWNLNSVAWFNKWNRFTGVRLNVYSMCSFWSSFWILTPYR